MSKRIGVADVRASFNRSVRNHVTVTYFGRPLGNLLTPLFYNTGWTANGVTYLSMSLSGAALLLLLWASPFAYAGAAFLFYLVFVFDCVDGNLARLSNTVSFYGKFLDGMSDGVFSFYAPLFAGIGLLIAGAPGYWLIVGALVTVTTLAAQMARSRFSFFREWTVGQSGPLTAEDEARLKAPKRLEQAAAFVFVNGSFVAPLLLAIPPIGAKGYLIWLAALHPAANIAWIASVTWQASAILRRPRRSIHATTLASPAP